MTPETEKALRESSKRHPFWICSVVFLLLACYFSMGLVNLVDQRKQLTNASVLQEQNLSSLEDAKRLETRLEALSVELLQIARTNATAKQIVQDFNIQWNPAALPAPSTSEGLKK